MGIKPRKGRPSLLGSVDVVNLTPEVHANTQHSSITEQEQKNDVLESTVQQPQDVTPMALSPEQMQNYPPQQQNVYKQQYQQTYSPNAVQPLQDIQLKQYQPVKAGRKRTYLIPGDIEKTISIQLPSSLLARIKKYAQLNDISIKEAIGFTLIEKFMK